MVYLQLAGTALGCPSPNFTAPPPPMRVALRNLKPNSWSCNFVEVLGLILESSQTPHTMFTLQTSFNPLVEVAVKSKEENSEDFCSSYVQEFGLWLGNPKNLTSFRPCIGAGNQGKNVVAHYKGNLWLIRVTVQLQHRKGKRIVLVGLGYGLGPPLSPLFLFHCFFSCSDFDTTTSTFDFTIPLCL